MRSISRPVLVLVLFTSCRSAPPDPEAGEATAPDAFEVVAEIDRLASRDLWPGFEPSTTPLAIFDGDRTLLFRHPAPPEEFEPLPGRAEAWSYPGRHPAVTANSSVEIDGVQTATLLPPADEASARDRAGLAIHEAFHAFQRERHPAWSADEAELFVYPVDDPESLTLRRLETAALRRALAGEDDETTACWAAAAIDLREVRHAGLPDGAVAYERATELNEGLATYVERRATGRPDSTAVPDDMFPAEAVRQRAYRTGVAIALLLDRLSPEWRITLERADTLSLDRLLGTALESRARTECDLTAAERRRAAAAAREDVEALRKRRADRRRAFLDRPGWRVTVVSPSTPLWPQGFDPVNVDVVAPGEVLHSRFVELGNEGATVGVFDRAALTEAAGSHPLFNGVRTVTVTGLEVEPEVVEDDDVVRVEAGGLKAELPGATVERSDRSVTIRLPEEG